LRFHSNEFCTQGLLTRPFIYVFVAVAVYALCLMLLWVSTVETGFGLVSHLYACMILRGNFNCFYNVYPKVRPVN